MASQEKVLAVSDQYWACPLWPQEENQGAVLSLIYEWRTLWIGGDYEHARKMWDIQDEVSKTVTLGKSSNTTCKSLHKDSITLEKKDCSSLFKFLS